MSTRTGHRRASSSELTPAGGRPVLLATMGVPLDEAAIAFAIDTAVETGGSLIVVNVTRLEPLALSVRLGYDALEEYTPEVSESLRKTTSSAVSMGVQVERLRIRSPRPVMALLEVVVERDPGILVFGPDRAALGSRAYRRAVARIRDADPCLLWTADEV